MNVGTLAEVKMENGDGYRRVKSKARTRVCVGLASYSKSCVGVGLQFARLPTQAKPSQGSRSSRATLQLWYSIRATASLRLVDHRRSVCQPFAVSLHTTKFNARL